MSVGHGHNILTLLLMDLSHLDQNSASTMGMGRRSGSCAAFPEQIVASRSRSSVPSCTSPSTDGSSIIKEDTNNKSLVAKHGTQHQQKNRRRGYDGQSNPELDDLSLFFAGDGVELPFSGVQSDDPSMFFYMPRYSHDNSATLWGLDEQFVGKQSFFPSSDYLQSSLSSTSTDFTSHVEDSQDSVPRLTSPKLNVSTPSSESTIVSDSQNGEAGFGAPKSNASGPSPLTLLKPEGCKGTQGVVGTLVSNSQDGEAALGAPKSNASCPIPPTLLMPEGRNGMKGAAGTLVSNSQNGEAGLGAPKSNASGPTPTLLKPKSYNGVEVVAGTLVSNSQNGAAAVGTPRSNASSPSRPILLKPVGHKRMEGVVGIQCSAQPSRCSTSYASNNASSSCLDSSYNTQFTKPANKVSQKTSNLCSAGPSNGYYPTQKFSSVSNQRNGGSSQQNCFQSLRPNGLSEVGAGKYHMRENFEKRGMNNSPGEFSRGPRASGLRNALCSSSSKEQLVSSIHKDQYNLKDFETKYEQAMFFVNGSGQFIGLAEMIGQVDFKKNMDFWQYDNWWDGFFPLKWHMIKDIPNNRFYHIVLENNENRSVIRSRDTQEIRFPQGSEMLRIFKNYPEKTSLLDDLDFYEAQEKSKISNHVSAHSRNNSQHQYLEGRKVESSTTVTLQRLAERETKVGEASMKAKITKGANQQPVATLAVLAKNFPDDVSRRATLQRHRLTEKKVETEVEEASTRARMTKGPNQPFTTLATLAKNFSINDSPQKT
ncbi:YTH domain-containing protein [Asimina triloba]